MGFIAEAKRKNLWFGTEERMEWFKTPSRGADTSPMGWDSEGTTLNGGGYVFNSFGSHKQYQFDWGSSNARVVAQKMKSYADGSYGRGYIYFVDPTIYDHNVLPAHWADPSMGIDYEGNSIVAGVDPVGVPTGANSNDLPVQAAQFNLNTIPVGFRGKAQAVYVPIPEGHTLSLGALYSFTGSGGVFASPVLLTGAIAAPQKLTTLGVNTPNIVADTFSGVRGVWLWVGKTATGNSTVTIHGLIGRLMTNAEATSHTIAENLFTNPNLVGDGTWAEVRRNYIRTPVLSESLSGWASNIEGVDPVADGVRTFASDVPPNAAILYRTNTADIATTSGEQWTISMRVRNNGPAAVSLRLSTTGLPTVAVVDIPAGDTVTLVQSGATTGTSIRPLLRYVGATGPVDVTVLDDPMAEKTAHEGTPFSGSTTPETAVGVDQPEDFRWRWLGAENASESVMEIERVRGLGAYNGIAGVSSWEGKPAARLIPTADTGLGTYFLLGGNLPQPGTFFATLNLREPLTNPGTSPVVHRRVYASTPTTYGDQAPNVAGSFRSRVYYETAAALVGNSGNLRGGGDVWWTDIGLFAGNYDGPAFSGSSPQDGTTHYRWTGAIDNSTSEAYYVSSKSVEQKRGPWVGGMGHSGCRFVGKPTFIENGPDWTGLSATFKEVVN